MVATLPVPARQLVAQRVAAVRLPVARPWRRVGRATGDALAWVAVEDGVVDLLRAQDRPATVVWVARDPRRTWGDDLIDHVLATAAGVTVWDTARLGEPDLLRLAYAAYASSGAGQVVVAAAAARPLVRDLRRRGVPASGGPPTL